MSPELAQALQSYGESTAPEPRVVVEEDNGPLGNLIMRPLRALGRTSPVQKAGEGLRWLSDELNALATKMGVIARGVTKEQAARQDEQALREKVARYRAFVGQQGTPGDEIAARHVALNTGREFAEDVADVNQRVTEEATREGVPMLAGVIAKKGLTAADDLADRAASGTSGVRRTTSQHSAELSRNLSREGRAVGQSEAAAHVVASTGSRGHWAASARSRVLLERYGVDINDPANGIPLGHPRPHSTMHTRAFQAEVEQRLNAVVNQMAEVGYGRRATRSALRRELRQIGREVIERE